MAWRGVIEEYRERIELDAGVEAITLLEGNTPLIEAPRLAATIGFDGRIFLKYEGLNPTCSFKDRGMTVALSAAVARGAKAVICASTGNTSAAAAAYAARAGIRAFVIVPEGNIALGKLSQAVMHGARVLAVRGNFDDAFRVVTGVAEQAQVTVVNSINPLRIQGQKTAAFEVCDVLGRAPDYHFLPVGNAGNITAYWLGYKEYEADGVSDRLPKMMGFQAAGAAPIVIGQQVDDPQTIASAIRIGNPVSWKGAAAARDESGGIIDSVTDRQIIEAYQQLAACEGVFAEPASAASIAGIKKAVSESRVEPGSTAVCTLTGHGLKDPTNAIEVCPEPTKIGPSVEEALQAMGLD